MRNGDENLQPEKISFVSKIKEKVMEFDIYSQPLNLTYKKKSGFKTNYGIFFSIITMFICILILVDSVIFYVPKNLCQYTDIDDTVQQSYKINFQTQLFIFFSVYNKHLEQYIDPIQMGLFNANYQVYSKTIKNNLLSTSPLGTTNYTFAKCTKTPDIDLLFYNTFSMDIFCPSSASAALDLENVNIYMTQLQFSLFNLIDDPVIFNSSYTNLVLELNIPAYSYDYYNRVFKIGYQKTKLNFLDFAFGPNIYEANLNKESFLFYNGYFNSFDQYMFYSMKDFYYDISLRDNTNNKLMTLKLNLPFYATVNYYQSFSIISSLGNVSGWFFLVTTIFGFLVGKCSRFRLYESVANDVFSLITPEGNKKVEETSKNIKDKLSYERSNILDLVVDDAHKYTKNDQLHLGFLGMLTYLFCCDCFKSQKTKAVERTLRKAIQELFKTIDIINVVNTSQEIRLLKEIIFEPYQKRLFENLIHPIITSDEVKCAYDIDYLETKAKTEEEKDAMSRANLKDALIQISSAETYNEIDFKLINLLNISPEFKQLFFKLQEKVENVKTKFFSLSKNPNVAKKQTIIKNFEKYLKQITNNIEEYKYINSSLIQETNDMMKNYKSLFEENKILKEVLYGEILLDNGYDLEEIKASSSNFVSYHPIILPKEQNKEQLEISRNINMMAKRKGTIAKLENIIEMLLILIDGVFCIRGKMKMLRGEYNIAVQNSFEAMQHCLRISFITFFVFLYFNVKSLLNNTVSTDCKSSVLCYGYFSFHYAPSDFQVTFAVSTIFYILFLFVYSLNLTLKFYLNRIDNEYLKHKFYYSKALFSSPSLKITSDEDAKTQKDTLVSSFAILDKHFNKRHFNSVLINLLIFIGNVLLVIINSVITLILIKYIKSASFNSYGIRIVLMSGVLSLTVNCFPLMNIFLIKLHRNLMPNTLHVFRFWFPFMSRYLAYLIYLSSSFEIFLGKTGNAFYDGYVLAYQIDEFQCREDQAAYNLIIFVLIEFVLRKLYLFVFSLFTEKNKVMYSVETSIINTMCNFLIFSVVTLVFPIQGVITFILFFIDFHLEFFFIKQYRLKPLSYNNDSKYGIYNIICLLGNLIVLVVITIIFQNQSAIMKNAVPEVTLNPALVETYPPFCLHQGISDDLTMKFQSSFTVYSLAIYVTVQHIVMIPLLFGIIFVMIYAKSTLNKFYSNMKILLFTLEDKKPKKITENFELTKRFNDILKTEYEVNKKNMTDEESVTDNHAIGGNHDGFYGTTVNITSALNFTRKRNIIPLPNNLMHLKLEEDL